MMKHVYQPTGISCGPTCLYMIKNHISNDSPSIEEICKICETDNVTGTPPERLIKGLDGLKINYIHHIEPKEPFQLISDVIENGNVLLLRTLTHGIPHWIVVIDVIENTSHINYLYTILDPWLGELHYDNNTLIDFWGKRNYECFEVVLNGN